MPRTPKEFRAKVLEMLSDEVYLVNLHIRLREGKLHPAVEKLFWEVAGVNPVRRVELDDRRGRPITGDESDPVKRARLLLEAAKELDSEKERVH